MKQITYYIAGMHCASCELLIEKQLLEEKNIHAVDASVSNGTIVITYENKPPAINKLNELFQEDGYTFHREKPQKERELLFYFVEGEQGLKIDKGLLKRKLKAIMSVGIIVFILFTLERSGIAHYVNVQGTSSLGMFFLFGVVAGLSSCAALVGGILLSLTKGWNEQVGYDASTKVKLQPHVYFHGGRIFAYAVLGAALGALGTALSFDNVTVYALITVAVSVLMFIIGMQMAGVAWAEKLQIRLPKFISRNIAGAQKRKTAQLPFAIGAGTVLLPCGFTLIAQGVALTSGSALRGAFMLTAFVLGTILPLLVIGMASIKGASNPKRARAFSFYAGVVLVLFALYNVNGQLNVLGWPSASDILAIPQTISERMDVDMRENVAGEQVISLTAKGFTYTLESASRINAGVPTTLVVDDQGAVGCSIFLAARGLMNGFVDLQPGKNVIDLGKPKRGTYKITCSMGMVTPVTIQVL